MCVYSFREAKCFVHDCGPGPEHTCMPGFADTLVADMVKYATNEAVGGEVGISDMI